MGQQRQMLWGVGLLAMLAVLADSGAPAAGSPSLAPSIAVSVTPSSQTVAPGYSVTFSISVTTTGTVAMPLHFALLNPPTGTTPTFNTSPPYGLTLAVPSSVPSGTYSLTIAVSDANAANAQMATTTLIVGPNAADSGGPIPPSGAGGGAGTSPSFRLTTSGPADVPVGGTAALIVSIANAGGNADSSTLDVGLTGLQLVGSKVDRGTGCSPSTDGTKASCPLGAFNTGTTAAEELDLKVVSLPASALAYMTSSPAAPTQASTWSGATAAASTPPAATTPPTQSPAGTTGAQVPPPTLTKLKAQTVTLNTRKPAIRMSFDLANTTNLKLTLRDPQGRIVATWTRSERRGSHNLKLALPTPARKAGKDTLRVVPSGADGRTLKIALRG
jgi:hypothetical protein